MVSTSHSHSVVRRIHRVGACPVLEATVTYPCLSVEEGGEAPSLTRFNEAYRAMAEAWLAWVESALLPAANEAFTAEGAGASYRFDRRVAVCEMKVETLTPEGAYLIVERTLRLTSRRGSAGEVCRRERETWRWPELTLVGENRKKGKEARNPATRG